MQSRLRRDTLVELIKSRSTLTHITVTFEPLDCCFASILHVWLYSVDHRVISSSQRIGFVQGPFKLNCIVLQTSCEVRHARIEIDFTLEIFTDFETPIL